MVWLLTSESGPDVTYGPMDPREEAAIKSFLASGHAGADPDAAADPHGPQVLRQAPAHLFIRDFAREELDRDREEAAMAAEAALGPRRERFRALMAEAREAARAAAAVAGGTAEASGDDDTATTEGDTESDSALGAAGPVSGVEEVRPSAAAAKKSLKWKEDEELAVMPMRVLRGATGVVTHQSEDLVFISFFDDETDDDAYAAAMRADVRGAPAPHSRPVSPAAAAYAAGSALSTTTSLPPTHLRLQVVTFDAEKLDGPENYNDFDITYFATDVKLKGKKIHTKDW